jgi:preprotein translocase subunit SecE
MTSMVTTKPSGNRFTMFISGLWAEMKKVVWLSRREVAYLTGLVLLVTVATGILLGLFDWGFSTVVDKLLIGK